MDTQGSEIGLNVQEKEGIKEVWKIARQNMKANGVEILIKFFTAYPGYQKLFRAFADVPLPELRQNKKLIAHATAVIYSLSSLVENLDDVENMKELAIKVSENHLPRGVSEQQFQELGLVIVDFLEEKLGDLFTPATKTGWEKLFRVVASIAGEVAQKNKSQKTI